MKTAEFDKNNARAFERLYPELLTFCMKYANSQDAAMDFLHDGIIRALEKIHTFEGRGNFDGWVKHVVKNRTIDTLRMKQKRETFFDSMELYKDLKENYEDKTNNEPQKDDLQMDKILSFAEELSPKFKTVFKMYTIGKMKHHEIAKELNISEGTSKSNLLRARRNMAKKIEKFIQNKEL